MSYDQFATTFSQSRKHHPWPELDAIIADIRTQGYMSVLDVGCGNGRFLEEWFKKNEEKQGLNGEEVNPPSKEGEEVGSPLTQIQKDAFDINYLGIDSSLGMIEEAKKLHPEYPFQVLDMTLLENLKTGELRNYDAIVLLASFHHLETEMERLTVLLSLRKMLSPNGRLYMTNWNLLGQPRYEKSHRGNGDFGIKIGEHVRYYHSFRIEELEALFKKTGFQIQENGIFEGGKNIFSVVTL